MADRPDIWSAIRDNEYYHSDASGFFLGPSNIPVSERDLSLYLPSNHDQGRLDNVLNEGAMDDESCATSSDLDFATPDSDQFEGDDKVNIKKRLSSLVPYDDGYIAFGTIRLYDREDPNAEVSSTHIRGVVTDAPYPNLLIKTGISKKWIRLDGLSVGTKFGITTLRVYILPEDVDRSTRGNLKDFRRTIKDLLNFVDCSTEAWNGQVDPRDPIQVYREPVCEAEESLFYIFNTLSSPQPDLAAYKGSSHGLQAMTDTLRDTITGMKTQLYPYQKRSIAAMIKKEADPAKIRDVRKRKMVDMYCKKFYLDTNDGSLYRQQPLYYEPKGGVLAETMGYGKTLICLALVMATRGHYPDIPQFCTEPLKDEEQQKTPSLLSMAARQIKYQGLPWKNEFYQLRKAGNHYDRIVQELQKYERAYNEPREGLTNPTRRGKPELSNIIRLCSGTLIVVPDNLIVQWKHEIQRHVDEDAIDVLVLDTSHAKVPPYDTLSKYDIVLISKSRFEQEYRDDDLHQGKSTRFAEKYKSPLTEVRWLRVICDEGHGFAGSATKTNAMAMLDKMSIERRWVVSGTPSNGLHGVEVSLASVESGALETSPTRPDSCGTALEQRRTPRTQESDAKDLERLRLIVCNFLKLQPWANKKGNDQADWKAYLTPRTDLDGKKYSRLALREVMQTLIIRHRIEDVDRDLSLPTLHNKITYLEPSYYDKLTINLFVMLLISNYVTSEREDEDYMFHPKSRGKLTSLINNFGYGTFYWLGITAQNIKDTLENGEKYLNKNIDKVTDEDGALLTEAIMNGQKALNDSGWQAFSDLHEMGTYISQFPKTAQAAWALDGQAGEPLLMGTTQAREVQRHVQARLEKDPANALGMLQRHGKKTLDAARSKAEKELKQMQKQRANTGNNEASAVDAPSKRAPTTSTSPAKTTTTTNGENDIADGSLSPTVVEAPVLPGTQVLGFASAKLTYLCDRVLSHPDEKSIIFYNHNNTAFFIAEALELLRVPFLIYANTLAVSKRAEYLAKFNADNETKVLLMDLKQAALGLHVAAASRVYIVCPIWDPALESQAIKRAHRIGQTREVYIETLVLKDTFEEALVKRRKEKAEQGQGGVNTDSSQTRDDLHQQTETPRKAKGAASNPMLQDSVMVKVLKNIRFLKIGENEDRIARLTAPVALFRPSGSKKLIQAGTDQSSMAGQAVVASAARADQLNQPSSASSSDFSRPSIFGTRSGLGLWSTNARSAKRASPSDMGSLMPTSKRAKIRSVFDDLNI
ncbi:hypothetical protein LTR64_000643 [Lithohypha guttulata]|uniref:uncharacterized protein n=1 Tax=Lithohypha guttulata TaxID=1690604 RepID=UPI00315CE018